MVDTLSFPDPAAFPVEQRVRNVQGTSEKMDRKGRNARHRARKEAAADEQAAETQDTDGEASSNSGRPGTVLARDIRGDPDEDGQETRLDVFA